MVERIARVALLSSLLLGAGCASLISAMFGRTVDIDLSDRSPASVRIVVPDAQTLGAGGDFVVTDTDATTRAVGSGVTLSVIGEDAQGVAFTALEDGLATPWCASVPEGRDGRPPPPPQPRAASPFSVRGSRVENDGSDGRATTRLPLSRSVSFARYGPSRHCPSDRPILHGVDLRLRALAANFGPGPATVTGEARILFGFTGGGGALTRPVGSAGGGRPAPSCDGAGDACETTPSECFGRGADWRVPGRMVCRGSTAVCEAREGIDYCAGYGENCGGATGDTCIRDSDCAPPAVCARPTSSSGRNHCQTLRVPEDSTPGADPPCPYVAGMCWTPEELDDDAVRALICRGE